MFNNFNSACCDFNSSVELIRKYIVHFSFTINLIKYFLLLNGPELNENII